MALIKRVLSSVMAIAMILSLGTMSVLAEDVGAGSSGLSNLEVTDVDFGSVTEGYGEVASKAVSITNKSNATIGISSVESSNTEHFTLTPGVSSVETGETNSSYKIQPKKGLLKGEYTSNITVTTADGEVCKAKATFVVTEKGVTPPDDVNFTKLNEAIADAEKAIEGVVVSVDGSDVSKGTNWVTAEVDKALAAVITEAGELLKDATVTQEAVDAMAADLLAAIGVYNTAKQDGTMTEVVEVDLTKLVTALDNAATVWGDNLYTSINNGVRISEDDFWVTPEVLAKFEAVLNAADELFFNENATQTEVDDAVTALNAATEEFAAKKTKGTVSVSDATLREISYTLDDPEDANAKWETIPVVAGKTAYTINLPSNAFVTYNVLTSNMKAKEDESGYIKGDMIGNSATDTLVFVSFDETNTITYKITFVWGGNGGGSTEGGGSSGGNTGDNTANKPETIDKIKDTVDAVKDLATLNPDKLPAGVNVSTTAGGASIATIPVKLTTGSANLNVDLFNTLGSASSKVGLELTVSSGVKGSTATIIVPGGFGKITEPGRLSFPMNFEDKAAEADVMLKAVKGEDAVSSTALIGGNYTLPVTATVTVKSTAPEGSTVNIYKYDPITKKYTSIGAAKVVKGQLTFATKLFGQMLFTTGKI